MSKLRDILCENSTEKDMEHAREAFAKALALDVFNYAKDEYSHARAMGTSDSFGRFVRRINKEQFTKVADHEENTKFIIRDAFEIFRQLAKAAPDSLSETAGDTFKSADSDINAMCREIAKVYTSRINATLKKQFDNQTANDDFDEFQKDHLVTQLKLIRSELPGKTDYIFQQIAALIKK